MVVLLSQAGSVYLQAWENQSEEQHTCLLQRESFIVRWLNKETGGWLDESFSLTVVQNLYRRLLHISKYAIHINS